jgi:hypothetical protein
MRRSVASSCLISAVTHSDSSFNTCCFASIGCSPLKFPGAFNPQNGAREQTKQKARCRTRTSQEFVLDFDDERDTKRAEIVVWAHDASQEMALVDASTIWRDSRLVAGKRRYRTSSFPEAPYGRSAEETLPPPWPATLPATVPRTALRAFLQCYAKGTLIQKGLLTPAMPCNGMRCILSASKSGGRKAVWVRPPPPGPF